MLELWEQENSGLFHAVLGILCWWMIKKSYTNEGRGKKASTKVAVCVREREFLKQLERHSGNVIVITHLFVAINVSQEPDVGGVRHLYLRAAVAFCRVASYYCSMM